MSDTLISLLLFTGIAFILLLLFWPGKGIIAFYAQYVEKKRRIILEDALRFIQHCEFHGGSATLNGLAGALNLSPGRVSDLLERMSELNFIQFGENEIHLTTKGVDYALHITRAHRLWEAFLAQETNFPLEELHRRADALEHTMTEKELEELSLQLGNPSYDPHGDPIPTDKGKIRKVVGKSITDMAINQTLRITHLEDEPQEVFAQLNAEGLHPGMFIHLVEKTPHKIRFWSKYGEHVLSPVIADNISVMPKKDVSIPQKRTVVTLSELPLGERAEIKSLSPRLRQVERRRLMDLGIIPGMTVEARLRGSHGDPTAYDIRGSLVALRQEQTNLIEVKLLNLKERGAGRV